MFLILKLWAALLVIMLMPVSFADNLSVYEKPDAKVVFNQAISLTVRGDLLDAEKLFKQMSQDYPEWPEPKNNLAIVQFKLGKIEQAQLAIEEAVTCLPSFKVAQQNRKRLYDHSAAVAYNKAIGSIDNPSLPELKLLHKINALETEVTPRTRLVEAVVDKSVSKQDVPSVVRQAVKSWSKSWSDLNIDQYLSSYSNQFKPSGSENDYTQWSNSRRAKFKFSGSVDVELQNIKVYLGEKDSQAVAEFVQRYKSRKYQDKVIKQLYLVLENDRWLIHSERVLQQLN